ncbi:alkyl hydroperoxide reductase [Natronococcus pandeyae]|uniref:Alkyl hydroperoxide reductase n=1 Tax=Natronococcus pandeyae TaxID=2055836 RepID=A0A8J8Q6N5_9EURY|nr:alkyl hydroperoxide reductase [Natronococcus pandeyae]TYL40411.1 alkyl hydroperoxide reductase [Natronococcus pandeyae]
MRRRELVAGIGSVGVLAGAGALLRYGAPTFEDDEDSESMADENDSDDGPIDVETIDARGSDAGTLTVPSDDVTVLMFFVNACGNCQAQVSRLTEARAQLQAEYPDEVTFLSVTYDSREQISPDELRDWWTTNGGDGFVSYDASDLMREYSAVGYPVTIVVDADGEAHWRDTGVTAASSLVSAVESVLEAESDDEDDEDEEGEQDGTGAEEDADDDEGGPEDDDSSEDGDSTDGRESETGTETDADGSESEDETDGGNESD